MDGSKELHVKFVESGEQSWHAVDAAERTFALVSPLEHGMAIIPGGDTVLRGRVSSRSQTLSKVRWIGQAVGFSVVSGFRPSAA